MCFISKADGPMCCAPGAARRNYGSRPFPPPDTGFGWYQPSEAGDCSDSSLDSGVPGS